MAFNAQEQDRLNDQHLLCPEPGDYWQEMFTPVCVVIEFTNGQVVLCEHTKPVGDNRWTWDLTQIQTMSHADFVQYLVYCGHAGNPWCDVVPHAHEWVPAYLLETAQPWMGTNS